MMCAGTGESYPNIHTVLNLRIGYLLRVSLIDCCRAVVTSSGRNTVVARMRRISLRPADPSSVRGELELKAEVKKAATAREGELKRRRDVAIEQVPCVGTGS